MEGSGERVLDHVLGLLLGAQHVPAETEDARPVALERDLERRLVPPPHLLDQGVVGGEPQQPPAAQRRDPRGVTREPDHVGGV
jgi:hypothetical protein